MRTGIALAWRYTALSDVLTADNIRTVLRTVRGELWAVVVVCLVFVLAGILVFPLNVLLLTTADGQMVRIGEESGELETMLTKIADFYDSEVEAMTKALNTTERRLNE